MTTFTINKKKYNLELKGHETLLEVLRDQLGLTGTKTACQEAECGACTILVDGKAVLSCITLACDVDGCDILTIEGLSDGDDLHPIQKAFLEMGAVQCGYCIPGMIMASKALLDQSSDPNREEIKQALDGNLCRCAGYIKIFDAVEHAAKLLKDEPKKK